MVDDLFHRTSLEAYVNTYVNVHIYLNVCARVLVVRVVLRRTNERKERSSQQMYGIVSSNIARWVHYSSDD